MKLFLIDFNSLTDQILTEVNHGSFYFKSAISGKPVQFRVSKNANVSHGTLVKSYIY